MPKVSIVSTVCRPGGIDILLAGMRDQTFKDFEVILVDRRYERRHARVMEMAEQYGVDLVHVPEHRRNGKWVGFASAWNTGFALAQGEYVLMLVDWSYAPPTWIEKHLAVLEGKRRYAFGPYRFLELPALILKKEFDFESIKWGEFDRCVDTNEVLDGHVFDEVDVFMDGRFDPAWIPQLTSTYTKDLRLNYGESARSNVDEGWLHIKNDSVTRSVLEELDGLDERLERGRGPLDIDLQIRLTVGRVETYWDPELYIWYMDPHSITQGYPWGGKSKRIEGRWSWNDGLGYADRRKVELSFGAPITAKNKQRLSVLSEKLAAWRDPKFVCPINDVTDLEYWGCEMWPDTP